MDIKNTRHLRSRKEKITAYCIGAIVVICSVIFIVTFVKADLYNPADTGMDTGIRMRNPMFIPFTSASSSISNSASTSIYFKNNATAVALPVQHGTNPSRLIIPALNINAHVQYVGINATGNIGTPNNFTDVAWYSYGVVPGEAGTAVIDGHVDNGLGLAGVFKHLSDIHIGDEVDIITKDSERVRFIVANIQKYDYQNVPAQAIFGTSLASSFLNLITCNGTWVQGGDTYNERLIVTARLMP
jgi:sortase (surface protein transpeptidase)